MTSETEEEKEHFRQLKEEHKKRVLEYAIQRAKELIEDLTRLQTETNRQKRFESLAVAMEGAHYVRDIAMKMFREEGFEPGSKKD